LVSKGGTYCEAAQSYIQILEYIRDCPKHTKCT